MFYFSIKDNVYAISRYQTYDIRVCSFEAKMCGSILKTPPPDVIRAISLDAINRKVFIAINRVEAFDVPNSRIMVSTLDGSKSKNIYNQTKSFITALVCDPYKKVIYFTDRHERTLKALSYDERFNKKKGVNSKFKVPTTIFDDIDIIRQPSALTWYENQIFIANLGSRDVMRCNLFGYRNCESFPINILNAEDIFFDGVTSQPLQMNPCQIANCHGICVQSTNGYECLCEDKLINGSYSCTFNHLIQNVGDFAVNRITTFVKESSPSPFCRVLAIMVFFVVLFLTLLFGIGYYTCHRHRQRMPRIFIRNTQFQNPLSDLLYNRHPQTLPMESGQSMPLQPSQPTPPSPQDSNNHEFESSQPEFSHKYNRNGDNNRQPTTSVFYCDVSRDVQLSEEGNMRKVLGNTTTPHISAFNYQSKTSKVLKKNTFTKV